MPNTKQQALNEMSDNESNETPMRVKMVKNTTGDASMAFAATVDFHGRCDKSTRAAGPVSKVDSSRLSIAASPRCRHCHCQACHC